MWEGTASRVMAAEIPYGEFYDFYNVSPEYFGYTLVFLNKVSAIEKSSICLLLCSSAEVLSHTLVQLASIYILH
jgi:hypothetical protein